MLSANGPVPAVARYRISVDMVEGLYLLSGKFDRDHFKLVARVNGTPVSSTDPAYKAQAWS